MYNREDYREALEEREKCDLHSDEWRFCQAKVQSIATAMVAAGNNWMVGEIIDELYSLSDCGCELTDEAVRFDLWILESNGLEEKAEEMKKNVLGKFFYLYNSQMSVSRETQFANLKGAYLHEGSIEEVKRFRG